MGKDNKDKKSLFLTKSGRTKLLKYFTLSSSMSDNDIIMVYKDKLLTYNDCMISTVFLNKEIITDICKSIHIDNEFKDNFENLDSISAFSDYLLSLHDHTSFELNYKNKSGKIENIITNDNVFELSFSEKCIEEILDYMSKNDDSFHKYPVIGVYNDDIKIEFQISDISINKEFYKIENKLDFNFNIYLPIELVNNIKKISNLNIYLYRSKNNSEYICNICCCVSDIMVDIKNIVLLRN